MQQFLSLTQLRAIEESALKDEINLIERAGRATAKWISEHFTKTSKILLVLGRGNNGSDGCATALELLKLGYKFDVINLFKENNPIMEQWLNRLQQEKKPLVKFPSDLNKYSLIIDALYGIGLTHELDVETAKTIQKINNSSAYILSLDTPSGLNPFTGQVQGAAIEADTTLTFIGDKPGLHTGDGLDHSGEVAIIDLLDISNYQAPETPLAIKFNSLAEIDYSCLMRSKLNSNKGSYGTVAVLGGNKGMHGALFLAGRAALLSGVGKVVLGALDTDFTLGFRMPELMYQSAKDIVRNLQAYDAVAIGPGLGQDERAYKILDKLLDNIEDSKLLVDADALNLIASNYELKLKFREVRYKIITPHPGEAARILGITVNEVQDNRFMSISDLTDKLNSVTLLKGAGSLIQEHNQIFINTTGNPALANAGQGDTLSCLIIGFLAQGMELLPATRLGAFIHGLAADRLVMQHQGYNGIFASEVATEAAIVLNELLYGEIFNSVKI